MSLGFNTDVRVGSTVLHVQTEERGSHNPMIDTTVYLKGRLLARRGTSYREFLASPDFNESELRAMVERQHREVIEAIRDGQLVELDHLALSSGEGIRVQVVNPGSILRGKTALVQAHVTSGGNKPAAGAAVSVRLRHGAGEALEFQATADEAGSVEIQFPLPRLGPGGAELVVEASSPDGRDEIRYSVRPRSKSGS